MKCVCEIKEYNIIDESVLGLGEGKDYLGMLTGAMRECCELY